MHTGPCLVKAEENSFEYKQCSLLETIVHIASTFSLSIYIYTSVSLLYIFLYHEAIQRAQNENNIWAAPKKEIEVKEV